MAERSHVEHVAEAGLRWCSRAPQLPRATASIATGGGFREAGWFDPPQEGSPTGGPWLGATRWDSRRWCKMASGAAPARTWWTPAPHSQASEGAEEPRPHRVPGEDDERVSLRLAMPSRRAGSWAAMSSAGGNSAARRTRGDAGGAAVAPAPAEPPVDRGRVPAVQASSSSHPGELSRVDEVHAHDARIGGTALHRREPQLDDVVRDLPAARQLHEPISARGGASAARRSSRA